jgi:putative tricarboxylic transport membrane protein
MHLSDRITGVFIAGLGAIAAYAGSKLPPVPGQQVGPNVFPMVVGTGMVVCGTLIALGVGRRFEEEAEAELAAHSDAATSGASTASSGWVYSLRVMIPPALLLFYVFAVDVLGFLITGLFMVTVAALALGARWRLAIPVALFATALTHLAFAKLLRVPLPAGLLGFPW